MDIIAVRSAMTVILFVLFLGIVFWAFSKKRKRAFDEAARLPFDEDEALPDKDVPRRVPPPTRKERRRE